MKILYITQFFYPEVGATTNRALANVRHLAKKHQVTVLTEMPNHPQGIIFEGYRKKLFMTEKMESFEVKRLWVWTSKKKMFYTRLLFYMSFALGGAIFALLKARKYDVIYLTSPPLFVSIIGLAAKLMNKKIIVEIRDLWPDSAIAIGELNNKMFINLSYKLEHLIYRKSAAIVAITQYIKEQIIAKGINAGKVKVVFNGVENRVFNLKPDRVIPEIEVKKKEGYYIVTFVGILGLVHDLETLVKAAKLLTNDKIHFFIIGTGPKEAYLKQQAAGVNNVTFLGQIEREQIHNYLIPSDCGITLCYREPLFKGTLPVKMFEYMAFGLPVLLGLEGEAEEIIKSADAGAAFVPENEHDLKEKLLCLINNRPKSKELGDKGRNYVRKHFSREQQAEIIEKMLREICGQ